jgi:hypothetical protein
MRKKWANVFEFFKSTLLINTSVCLVAMLFGGIDSFFFIFTSFGFAISLLYKQVYRNNDYLFYANNGLSKRQLILSSYFFIFSFGVFELFAMLILKKIF